MIPAEIMRLHHSKHHQAYVTNLNAGAEKYAAAEARNDVAAMISLQPALKFNGGGHLNHSMFWKMLSPKGGGKPAGALAAAIDKAFGGFDAFKEQFGAAAANHFGSGWAWLCEDATGKLVITTLPNQDNPMSQGLKPLLGLDVWEHAYYLKYQNRRPEYISAFWNIVSWEQIAANFADRG